MLNPLLAGCAQGCELSIPCTPLRSFRVSIRFLGGNHGILHLGNLGLS